MRLSKLSYVTLWAVHFDQVKDLYKETLGLPVAQENENFVMFDTKGSGLAFHRLTKAPPLSRSTVEVHLEVNDVDKVYSSLKSKGVKTLSTSFTSKCTSTVERESGGALEVHLEVNDVDKVYSTSFT